MSPENVAQKDCKVPGTAGFQPAGSANQGKILAFGDKKQMDETDAGGTPVIHILNIAVLLHTRKPGAGGPWGPVENSS